MTTIVVLRGDQTGQELLDESLRVIDPGVIDVELDLKTFDLSLAHRRATSNAVVGAADTVNGGIALESHATAAKLTTVNGSIQLQEAARVSGAVHTVNGQLTLADGADVSGSLKNVNGLIRVAAAHVAGGIETVTGGIELGPNARVEGGILIQEDTSWFGWFFGWVGLDSGNAVPRVVIGPGSVVTGTLRFERPVKLYVSDRATIGNVVGATAVKFSADQPPR